MFLRQFFASETCGLRSCGAAALFCAVHLFCAVRLICCLQHLGCFCCCFLLVTGEGTSSVLRLVNVLRVRIACAPNAEELAAALRATPRAPPGNGVTATTSNQVALETLSYSGTEYPGVLIACT
jgi:hypothetical protein